MKKILSYCKPFTGFIALSMLIKVIGTIMDLFIPYLLGYILDEVVPGCTAENLTPVFLWGSLMLLCAVVALAGNVTANRRVSFFSKEVVARVRSDMFRKTLSLSAAQTDAFTVPSLVSRLSSDSYTLQNTLNTVLRAGMRAPILLLGGVIMTLTIEPVLALSFIVLLPFMALIITYVSRKGIKLFKEKQARVDSMVEKVRDTFTGIRVIKALSKTEHEKESFSQINTRLSRGEEKANVTMAISRPVINLFLNLGMTAVIILGAWRVQGGFTTPGQIISFMSYFTIILNATLMLTRTFTMISRGVASADRIRDVLEEKKDLLLLPETEAENGAPFLEFRDVTFSYNKTIPTVEHISFKLEKGQTLGIIGGTGSGKTTLVQLLLRFYDPDEGCILLEGRDLRTIPPEELRHRFGTVLQNDFLMAGDLSENVRFGREISDEAMKQAAEHAQALPFILDKGGFQAELTTKGANLSGGQRQRLLITRALAGKPEILILDDSSSALDYKTDATLRVALREHYDDATCIVVAQRISSIRHSDLILVLEHGEMIGKGKDEDLMEACEVYREIAHSQMGEVSA